MIGLTLLGRLQIVKSLITLQVLCKAVSIGPLHDPVTWYGINYAGTQVTQWDFQSKETRASPARLAFALEVPLCNLSQHNLFRTMSPDRAKDLLWPQI